MLSMSFMRSYFRGSRIYVPIPPPLRLLWCLNPGESNHKLIQNLHKFLLSISSSSLMMPSAAVQTITARRQVTSKKESNNIGDLNNIDNKLVMETTVSFIFSTGKLEYVLVSVLSW